MSLCADAVKVIYEGYKRLTGAKLAVFGRVRID